MERNVEEEHISYFFTWTFIFYIGLRFLLNPLIGFITTSNLSSSVCSQSWVRGRLEAGERDKKYIFVKDMAAGIVDNLEKLPKGVRIWGGK